MKNYTKAKCCGNCIHFDRNFNVCITFEILIDKEFDNCDDFEEYISQKIEEIWKNDFQEELK